MKINKSKLTVYLIVLSLAGYGIQQLHKNVDITYNEQRAVIEQPTVIQPAALPPFKLSNNIDQYEADKQLFWASIEQEAL